MWSLLDPGTPFMVEALLPSTIGSGWAKNLFVVESPLLSGLHWSWSTLRNVESTPVLTLLNRGVAEPTEGGIFSDEEGTKCRMFEGICQEEGIYRENAINAPADHAYSRIEVTTFNPIAVVRASEQNWHPPISRLPKIWRVIKAAPRVPEPGIRGITHHNYFEKGDMLQAWIPKNSNSKEMPVINSFTCKIQIREFGGNCWENYYSPEPNFRPSRVRNYNQEL